MHVWVVSWQTERMSAPSFWYFGHLAKAQDAYLSLKRSGSHVDPPARRQVPEWTPLLDRQPYEVDHGNVD